MEPVRKIIRQILLETSAPKKGDADVEAVARVMHDRFVDLLRHYDENEGAFEKDYNAYYKNDPGFDKLESKDLHYDYMWAKRAIKALKLKPQVKEVVEEAISEVFESGPFPYKLESSREGYRSGGEIKIYGFEAGGYKYRVWFETWETFSGKFGKIDFNVDRGEGEYPDPTGDVMHKMSDTVRVMATIGAIIDENTKEIDYLVIESTSRRLRSYKALIPKLKNFTVEYERGDRITLRKKTSPHMQGVKPDVKSSEPAMVSEFNEKMRSEVVVIYRDKNIVAMVPKSQMASNIYGHGTKWCQVTRTGFDSWSKSGLLVRFLFKGGRKVRFTYYFKDLAKRYALDYYWANETGHHVLHGKGNPFEVQSERNGKRTSSIETDILDMITKIPQECKNSVLEFLEKNKKAFEYCYRKTDYSPQGMSPKIKKVQELESSSMGKHISELEKGHPNVKIRFGLDKGSGKFSIEYSNVFGINNNYILHKEEFDDPQVFEYRLRDVYEQFSFAEYEKEKESGKSSLQPQH